MYVALIQNMKSPQLYMTCILHMYQQEYPFDVSQTYHLDFNLGIPCIISTTSQHMTRPPQLLHKQLVVTDTYIFCQDITNENISMCDDDREPIYLY